MSRTTERQRAVALKAADARDLIKSSLPFALQQMSAAQIDRVQRVLDAFVVNPAVQKEAADLDRKSIKLQVGELVSRDEAIVRRADKVRADYIPVREAELARPPGLREVAGARRAEADDGQPRRSGVFRQGQADPREPGCLAEVRSQDVPSAR